MGTQLGNNVDNKDWKEDGDKNYCKPFNGRCKPGLNCSNGYDWAEAKTYSSQEKTAKPKSKVTLYSHHTTNNHVSLFISFKVVEDRG